MNKVFKTVEYSVRQNMWTDLRDKFAEVLCAKTVEATTDEVDTLYFDILSPIKDTLRREFNG